MPDTHTYVVTYQYVPGMLERRAPYRPDHLAHLHQAVADGRLLMAGAHADPVDGATLIVEGENAADVLAWVARDPFMHAGLILGVTIREWTISVRRVTA